ncbi:MAG: sulfurtransferase [Candidatus Geothermarchaeales archaeon]
MSYAHPEVLVDTAWVEDHLEDPKVRVAEVDFDPEANYKLGHAPGAVLFDWKKDFNEPVRRDILTREALGELLGRSGVSEDTTIALYGDFNNWFATFAFWVLKYYGVEDVKIVNGGRQKWLEEDRPVTKEVPTYPKTEFKVSEPDERIRVYLDYASSSLAYLPEQKILVDVRSPAEFTGEILAPPEFPNEGGQRGGHIPGAVNIPWSKAVNEDGTFKSAEELKSIYEPEHVTPEKEVITYCRIGERAAFSWFVLKYLLGYPNVRNYDGSWSEWGNLVRQPIEK